MLRKDDFMEKIILKNGQEFYVPQLGVVSNDITKRRRITIKTDMDYNDVLAILSNKDNISEIKYSLENGTTIATYTDCVSLKSLSCDLENGTYTAEFGTDATERIVQELQAKVEQMQQTIDELKTAKESPVEIPAEEQEEEPEPEEPEDDEPEGTPEEPADETTDEPEEAPKDEPTEEAEEPEDNTDSEPAEP